MENSTDAVIVTETDVLLKALRQELKEWEMSFFEEHNRKAGREDIKQNAEIGDKYKQYNSLRYPLSNPAVPKATTSSRKRPRNATLCPSPSSVTPNKRSKHAHPLHPSAIDPYDAPILTLLSPATHRTSIGPTPQKEGQVLGLFDNLSSGLQSKTPSRRDKLLQMVQNNQATPTKGLSSQDREPQLPATGKRHYRSPLIASKRSHLNTYLTPSASRTVNNSTPCSRGGVSKLYLDETPAFLRRDSQRAISGKENEVIEADILWSPVAVRKLPKAAGKGLSALVKGLRDMEDEALDEELDMLREMEGDAFQSIKARQPKILMNDSQAPDMPLGPDGGIEIGDDVGGKEGKGRDGKPVKVWKKKGQKRTTRKVVLKPSMATWNPEPAWKEGTDSEEVCERAFVEESQIKTIKSIGDEEDYEDDESSAQGGMEERGEKPKAVQERGEVKKDGFATKIKKKISATAHANFRALKIKNKQSKGKRGGRFGRKR